MPGGAQSARMPANARSHREAILPGLVRENIHVLEAIEVEAGAVRQIAETRLGRLQPPLTPEHPFELRLQLMQMQNVRGGVGELLLGQRGGAPIGTLLLLGQLNTEKF